jgi:hypothetical protein
MAHFLPVVICLTLTGCAAATEASRNVVFAGSAATVAECQMLGQIQAQSLWDGSDASGVAYNDALTSLRQRASALGATRILIVKSAKASDGTTIIGNAYRCSL